MSEAKMSKGAIAFEQTSGGYLFRATYLDETRGEALIEIEKDGAVVRSILWPAYKIWNIAAHAEEIAEGLNADNDDGLSLAGSTGFGGNVYSSSPTHTEKP